MRKKLLVLFFFIFLILGLLSLAYIGNYYVGDYYTKDKIRYKLSFLLRRGPTESYPFVNTSEEPASQDASLLFSRKDVEFPFTFIVFGDSRGSNFGVRERITERIIKEKPDFVLHTGDFVNRADEEYWKLYDKYEGRIQQSGIPLYPVLGNHEYVTKPDSIEEDPLSHYFERFKMLNGKHWYSFEYGNALFVMLDTNADYREGSPQYNWLISQLKKNPTFLIVTFHHPPYTKTRHRRDADRFLASLFENAPEMGLRKPDMVFSGHGHNYERYRYGGITYVVSGGGGAPPYYVERSPNDFYNESGETYHYVKVTVNRSSLMLEMVKLEGDEWEVKDTFTSVVNGTMKMTPLLNSAFPSSN